MAQSSNKPRIFYGWWIVLSSFIVLFVDIGIGFMHFGLFLKELAKDFAQGRGAITWAHTLRSITEGVVNPIVGRCTDRYGPKAMMLIGIVVMGIAFFLLSRVRAFWQIYPLYVLVGISFVSMGLVPSSAAVAYWFTERRGLAMGITVSGMSVGVIAITPLAEYLISSYGWRISYLILGLITLGLPTPVVAFLMKRSPDQEQKRQFKALQPSRKAGMTFTEAWRTSTFWLFFTVFLVIHIAYLSILVHLFPYATDLGVRRAVARWLLPFNSVLSLVGRLIFGLLADKFNRKYLFMYTSLLQALGIVFILKSHSFPMIFISLIFFGSGLGGQVLLQPLLVVDCFGMAAFGEIYGWLHVAVALGSATGPLFSGYIFDLTRSYYWAFMTLIILYLIAFSLIPLTRTLKERTGKTAL